MYSLHSDIAVLVVLAQRELVWYPCLMGDQAEFSSHTISSFVGPTSPLHRRCTAYAYEVCVVPRATLVRRSLSVYIRVLYV